MPAKSSPPSVTEAVASPEYLAASEHHAEFKDRVYGILTGRFDDVVRDTPRGRHNLDFSFKENFFGFARLWAVVTWSEAKLMPYDRATRVVSGFREEIENRVYDGVLVVTAIGQEKAAEDFLANNFGFLHRTIDDLGNAAAGAGFDRAVKIDKANPSYEQAKQRIEEAAATLSASNHPDLTASLKERLTKQLKSSVELLEADEVDLELVVRLMLKTLRHIAGKLYGVASTAAATAAITELIHLFRLH